MNENGSKNPLEEQLKNEYRIYADRLEEAHCTYQNALGDFARGKIDRRTLDLLRGGYDYCRGQFNRTVELLVKFFPETAVALYNELTATTRDFV